MKKLLSKTLTILIAVLLMVCVGAVNATASTPTVTPTVTMTMGATAIPTFTPTVTPTIPVAVNTWFRTTAKSIMTEDKVFYDNCGNVKMIKTGVTPREYYAIFEKRNIIYKYLRVNKGMTNAQIQASLKTKEDFMRLYLFGVRKGIIEEVK